MRINIFILFLGVFFMNDLFAYQVIAHRGSSGEAPENTLPAIKLAEEQNSDYIEIDFHMTKDGEIVAFHDKTLNRTTDGRGRIDHYTYEELSKLDAGSWFDAKFKGTKVPKLADIFEQVQKETKLILEFKYGHPKYPKLEEKVVSLIQKYNMSERVILKSFDTEIIDRFEKLAPTIGRLYVLFASWDGLTIDNFLRFRSMLDISNVSYYQVHQLFINRSLVTKVHKEGKKIIAWGVKKKHLPEMIKMGVDILEVDYPTHFTAK